MVFYQDLSKMISCLGQDIADNGRCFYYCIKHKHQTCLYVDIKLIYIDDAIVKPLKILIQLDIKFRLVSMWT